MRIIQVGPEALDLTLGRLRILSGAAVASMKLSLEDHGQMSPLIAGEQDTGALCLIDGFKRQRAAVELGVSSLDVMVVRVSSLEMKAQLYLRNRHNGFTLVEECLLISELRRLDGLSQVEIGDLLKRHKSWVCRRLQFIERLSPHLLEEVRVGLLEPGSARKLSVLPPGNQEEMAAVVKAQRLKPHETACLVRLYQTAPTGEAKRFVLTHPREALGHLHDDGPDEPNDPRLSPRAQKIHKGLCILARVCDRVAIALERGLGGVHGDARILMQEAAARATTAMDRVRGAVERLHKKGEPS
jgi:ParB-like chromosome segregation protein Spo0J